MCLPASARIERSKHPMLVCRTRTFLTSEISEISQLLDDVGQKNVEGSKSHVVPHTPFALCASLSLCPPAPPPQPLQGHTTQGIYFIVQTRDDFYKPGDGGSPGKHSILINLVAVGDVGDHLRCGVAGLCGRIWLAAPGSRPAAATKNRCVGGAV